MCLGYMQIEIVLNSVQLEAVLLLMQIEAIAFSVDGCPGGCLVFEDNCEKVGSPTFPEDWVKEGSVRVALVS